MYLLFFQFISSVAVICMYTVVMARVYRRFDRPVVDKIRQCLAAEGRVMISEKIKNDLHINIKNQNQKRASVLIPLCNVNDTPSILFTLRSNKTSTHKSQVSFPGGHIDDNETAEEAALRETFEEIGLNKSSIEVLAEFQTIPAITNTLVTPLLGYIGDVDVNSLTPSPNEVDKIFVRSISELCDSNKRSIETLSRNGVTLEFPVFWDVGKNEKIWGLTALILNTTLNKAILPNMNTN